MKYLLLITLGLCTSSIAFADGNDCPDLAGTYTCSGHLESFTLTASNTPTADEEVRQYNLNFSDSRILPYEGLADGKYIQIASNKPKGTDDTNLEQVMSICLAGNLHLHHMESSKNWYMYDTRYSLEQTESGNDFVFKMESRQLDYSARPSKFERTAFCKKNI